MSDIDSRIDEDTEPEKTRRPRDPELWMQRPIEKFRKRKNPFEFQPNAAFFAVADPVVEAERTLLGFNRLYVLWQVIRNVADVPGGAAEIGSYQGGSAYFIASVLASVTGSEVPMHVIDTFEGHPEEAITEHDPFHTAGKFNKTSYDKVREYLSPFQQLQVHKGDVSNVLPHLADATYRLVHIDTDLYQPTLVCLDYFVPRLSSRGIIVVDDYGSKKCPGVPKAVSEYLDTHEELRPWDMRTGQLLLIKD